MTPVLDPELPRGAAKRQAVVAMFDRVAPRYDRMNRIISLGNDRRWRRHAIGALGLAPGARVLDLACGTGDLSRGATATGYAPFGIDMSDGMLTRARIMSAAPVVRGDAELLPVASGSLDGVVCGFALRNFVDLEAVFAECARVLRPGGRFVALDAAVPEHRLLRLGNAIWFRGAVPVLGRLLAHDAAAYRYLPRSTAYLPEPEALVAMLERTGFTTVARHTMTGGSVQLLSGTRT